MTDNMNCEWCGLLTEPGQTLCRSCTWAKEQSEKNALQHAPQEKRTVAEKVTHFALELGKGVVAAALSLIALGAAAMGTCGVAGTIAGSPSFITFAVIGFGIAALLLWLIYTMYQSDLSSSNRPSRMWIPAGPAPATEKTENKNDEHKPHDEPPQDGTEQT